MYKKAIILLAGMQFILILTYGCGFLISANLGASEFAFLEKREESLPMNFLGVSKRQASKRPVLSVESLEKESVSNLMSEEDYGNLLRIVEAEAGGEDKTGKKLVVNVVMNRVKDKGFPDTVSEVILQQDHGTTQFSPVKDGRFYSIKVSEDTENAVKEALEEGDRSGGALYFIGKKISKEKARWFEENLTPLFSYGGHAFYG